MMNQTEILKHRNGAQNKSFENINESQLTGQSSKVTIIKANAYQVGRERTPKMQISSKQNSSNKLVRINSAKGIHVISTRPTSTQKEIREFNTANSNNNISIGGSQTTIKLEQNSNIYSKMKQQLSRVSLFYEQKMTKQLQNQHNYFTGQINHMNELLIVNQERLNKQRFELDQLFNRVETVQKKIQAKTNLMSKQLTEFRRFYDQCYDYTIKRITQAEQNMKSMIKYIEQATSTVQKVESWKYVEYANNIIKNIVVNCSAQTSSLKYYLNDELHQLQIGLGKFHDQYQQIDKIVHEMKSIKFGNQSLKDCVKQLGKFGIHTNNLKKDNHKQNFLQYYEPKFKEIIKRVNNSAIQVDLVRSLIKSQGQVYSSKNILQGQKIEELTKIIQTLEKKIDDDKTWYMLQLTQRQENINKTNPRILQLETKLHSSYEQQAKMLKEISDLKLKISYLQTKCDKTTQRQYSIQSSLAQAFSETLVKEKAKKYQQQKIQLKKIIQKLEQKIRQLDHENYLLAEKLSKSEQNKSTSHKIELQLKFAAKMMSQYQQTRRNLIQELQICQKQKQELDKELKHKNEQLQTKITNLLSEKNKVNQDDEQYFDQLEQEVEKNHMKIEKLQLMNEQTKSKNKQLVLINQQLAKKNQQLEEDLHIYAQTFEKQSITFRNALQNLQKEKDILGVQNKKILQQNKFLKLDLQQTKTAQSFYQNYSNISLQLKKTMSSDLGEAKPMKKIQRRSLSTKQKIDKISQLKNVLDKLKCDLPVLCQVDATGHLKDQRTGCYFFDQNQNCFELDQTQLTKAIQMGLILL